MREPVPLSLIRELAEAIFGDFVKAVVDVQQRIMVLGGELHSDEEALLLDSGAGQSDLWGINLYPVEYGEDDWIEFDSMINVRPRDNNRSRSVENPALQMLIREIVAGLVRDD